jgi:2-dehydro-3-deoxy-D-arabinonate dehydratase
VNVREAAVGVMMKLSATHDGWFGERDGMHRRLPAGADVDALLTADDPHAMADEWFAAGSPAEPPTDVLAPIASQEVWAAGVTYLRSRVARATESHDSGADVFYDRVYDAERPELFFKATPHRVVGPGGTVRIRSDSEWNVPEPELALVLDRAGRIVGHTIGNDMSSRSIEGDNPLYLPQAKVYRGCCALGPAIVLVEQPPGTDTAIEMTIRRSGVEVFTGHTTVLQIKRGFEELVEWLFRANEFPHGAFLLTGTGIVPPDEFTLAVGDEVAITIDGVGTLRNDVELA